jgi:hypothetical protein
MEEKKINIIPLDEMVTLTVSGHYMQRVKYLGDYLVKEYGQEKFIAFLKQMIENNGSPQTELEEHLLTISALMNEFEVSANKQDKMKQITEKEMAERISKNGISGS